MAIQKLLVEEGAKRALKVSRDYSVRMLGYDFFGLIRRLAIFFITGFFINAYFQATISGGIWLNTAANLFGLKFPSTLPQWVTELFTTGYHNITFWQVVQVAAIIIVVVEYIQYDKKLKLDKEKANPTTMAVFTMIALGLSLITFPQMIQKIKEMRVINGT